MMGQLPDNPTTGERYAAAGQMHFRMYRADACGLSRGTPRDLGPTIKTAVNRGAKCVHTVRAAVFGSVKRKLGQREKPGAISCNRAQRSLAGMADVESLLEGLAIIHVALVG